MKTLVFTLFLASISLNSFADNSKLECQIIDPCINKEGLGICLEPNFVIRPEIINGKSVHAAIIALESYARGGTHIYAVIPVYETISEGHRFITGSSDDGDGINKIVLYSKGLRKTPSTLVGSLTLENDFVFKISCLQ